MNIFWLDTDLKKSAEYACDQHIVKMITEHTQLLVTALHVFGFQDLPMKTTHTNHPCGVWVRERFANFYCLYLLTKEYTTEYTARYNKPTHLSYEKLKEAVSKAGWSNIRGAYEKTADITCLIEKEILKRNLLSLISVPPQCVPDQYQVVLSGNHSADLNSIVQVYRKVYKSEKSKFARWNHSNKPSFMQ